MRCPRGSIGFGGVLPTSAVLLVAGALVLTSGVVVLAGDEPSMRDALREEARKLEPLVTTELARGFLAAVNALPERVPDRIVYERKDPRDVLTEREAAARGPEALEAYARLTIGERFYYTTKYGTPLAAVRALDLVSGAGIETVDGARILDFGFGSIGQLRLLASLGANVNGVEVDPLLRAVYSEQEDTGLVARARVAGRGAPGSIRLHWGQFPADARLVEDVGGGYDLFVSKNTLKRGYVHPAEEVDPRFLVHLGVDDETFVRALARLLAPGGLALIYNLCPAPAPEGEPYKPWADGRSPFARELYERTGFEVLAFDENDDAAARRMGETLGWGEQMNLEEDLFGVYTLLRRKP